jgi:hypothetical protein
MAGLLERVVPADRPVVAGTLEIQVSEVTNHLKALTAIQPFPVDLMET